VDPALDSTVMAKFRTHLALERTTLAWIRTALTMATFGFGIAAFFRTVHARILRPGTAVAGLPSCATSSVPLRIAFDRLDQAFARWCPYVQNAA